MARTAWRDYTRHRRYQRGNQTSRVDREIASAKAAIPEAVEQDVDVTVQVPLSPLAYQVLVAIQERTHQRRGEVVETLLRECGAALGA